MLTWAKTGNEIYARIEQVMIGTLCTLPFALPFAMNNAVGTPTTLSPAAVRLRQGSLFKKEIEDTNLLAAEAGEGLDRVREGAVLGHVRARVLVDDVADSVDEELDVRKGAA